MPDVELPEEVRESLRRFVLTYRTPDSVEYFAGWDGLGVGYNEDWVETPILAMFFRTRESAERIKADLAEPQWLTIEELA